MIKHPVESICLNTSIYIVDVVETLISVERPIQLGLQLRQNEH